LNLMAFGAVGWCEGDFLPEIGGADTDGKHCGVSEDLSTDNLWEGLLLGIRVRLSGNFNPVPDFATSFSL
jgi:hypothetical protein